MQLFCFTHAGGTAAFYDQLESAAGKNICFEKLEYAGHGSRRKESCYQSLSELEEDLYGQIRDRCIGEYALMGYSMGCISLMTVLHRIQQEGRIPLPKCVFLAAHEPVTQTFLKSIPEQQMDEMIQKRMIHLGGVPDALIKNKSFWRMYMPVYRADYSLICSFSFEDVSMRTKIPAIIFYSEQDTPLQSMTGWKNYFEGICRFVRYSGTHFFIQKHYLDMAKIVRAELEEYGEKKNDI